MQSKLITFAFLILTSAAALGQNALPKTGALCPSGQLATGVDATGTATACVDVLSSVPPPSPVSVGSTVITITLANDTVTGTTTNKLVKISATGKAIITSAGDITGAVGICISGCGTAGNAQVAVLGTASCVSDNATTIGHQLTISTSVAGDCTDAGTTYPTGTEVIGQAQETGVAGTRSVLVSTDFASASNPGGGKGQNITFNGTSPKATANFNAATPAAPSGSTNVTFQTSNSVNTTSVSAYIPSATFMYGGDGTDGAVTFDGTTLYATLATTSGVAPNLTYTLIKDVYATTVVVSASIVVKTANYAVFANVSITNAGSINNNGNAGGNATNANGATAGGAGSGAASLGADPARFFRFAFPVAGQNGAAGVVGVGAQPSAANAASANGCNSILNSASGGATGASGGAGGNGGSGSGGAARAGSAGASAPTLSQNKARDPDSAMRGFANWYSSGGIQSTVVCANGNAGGANGGSSGAGDGANAGGGGGGGGQEGGTGGIILVSAPLIVNSGTISANGGTGGNGGNGGTRGATGNTGGGGGGASGHGGRGGIVFILANTVSNSGTISATGGAPGSIGTLGAGSGTGTNGTNGGTGSTGNAGFVVQISQ